MFSFCLVIFHISRLINIFNQLRMQAMSKFITASRQATEMEWERIRLEARIHEVQADCKGRAEVAAKAMDEVKESLRPMSSRRIPVLSIFKRGTTSFVPFLKKPREMLLRNSEHLASSLTFWTRIMLLVLRTSV